MRGFLTIPFFGLGAGLGFAFVWLTWPLMLEDALIWHSSERLVQIPAQSVSASTDYRSKSTYWLKLSYQYEYQGKLMSGSKSCLFGDCFLSKNRWLANEKLAQIKAAAPLKVWVDPIQPQRSFYSRDMTGGLLRLKGLLGVLFSPLLAFGAAFMCLREIGLFKGQSR